MTREATRGGPRTGNGETRRGTTRKGPLGSSPAAGEAARPSTPSLSASPDNTSINHRLLNPGRELRLRQRLSLSRSEEVFPLHFSLPYLYFWNPTVSFFLFLSLFALILLKQLIWIFSDSLLSLRRFSSKS